MTLSQHHCDLTFLAVAIAIQSFQVLDLGKVCGDGISLAETKHEATVLRIKTK